MPRRGLPETVRMRHDAHYVEALAASAGAPIGRLIPIDRIDPNPNQPRQVMGDLSELMASVAEKGVIEPLIVRGRGDRFQIIAGERRYQAAVQVGLRELPLSFATSMTPRLSSSRSSRIFSVRISPRSKKQKPCISSPNGVRTPTRRLHASSASLEPRSQSRSRSMRCPRR